MTFDDIDLKAIREKFARLGEGLEALRGHL
jgi:hypothetical protein